MTYRAPMLALVAGAMFVSAASARADDRAMVGGGVAIVPGYQGSDDYRILPVPMIHVEIGRLFATMNNGIGMYLVDTPNVKVGGSLTIVRGYRHRDVPDGIDRLKSAPGARIFASADIGPLRANVGATRSLGGTDGVVVDGGLAYPIAAAKELTLLPSVGTTWASRRYMDRYFGVTASEAAASGLSFHRGEAGFKDVTASLSATYHLTGGLYATGSAGVTHLFGEAGKSPLVSERWQPVGLVGVSYAF